MLEPQLFGAPVAHKVQDARNRNHQLSKEAVRRMVGERLAQARMANDWNQSRAADKLGHKNSTQVCLWEKGDRMPPFYELRHVAQVYAVSLDYLMGLSPSMDRDPLASMQVHLLGEQRDMMTLMQREMVEAIIRMSKTGGPTVAISRTMVGEGRGFLDACRRFVHLNKDAFEEDMRGSNNLLAAMDSFEFNCLGPAVEQIERFRKVGTASVKSTLNKLSTNDDKTASLFNPVGG